MSVIETLRARGVIAADAAAPEVEETHRPWFVSLMLGAAGWLAGLLLLLFIGLTFKPDDSAAFIALGLVLLGSAWGLYRADPSAAFLGQLALTLSIAGQIALAVGLLEDVKSALVIAAVLMVLQLLVLAVMPDKTARTLATLFAGIAWVYTVRFAVFTGSGWDSLFEPGIEKARFGPWSTAIAWIVTWVPVLALTYWLMAREPQWMSQSLRKYARPMLSGLLVSLALAGMASEPLIMLALGPGQLGMDLGWWSVFSLLSVALAMFAAWCAFRLRSTGLSGLAIVAALLHLGRFYYLHGTSLLWKSVIMLVVGIVLLMAAFMLRRDDAAAGSAP